MLSSPGPCAWSRSASSRAPTSTGSSRWSSSRSPSAGDGPGTASAIPGRHALVQLGAAVPARDWPDRRRRRSSPGSAGCGATTARARGGVGRPPLVRPGPLDRHVPVGRARSGPGRSPRRRSRSPSATCRRRRTARLTGAQERLLARWPSAIAAAADDAADVDPRRRPADPGRLDPRHERQEHGHPADHPHPAAARAGGSGRRPRTACSSTSGSSSRATGPGPGGAHADPAPVATSTSRSSRPPAAGSSCAAMGYESNEASVLTNVSLRPPRPPGHPHPARAGRGEVDDRPDHASPTAGSCSTPTTRSSPRSPAASGPRRAASRSRRRRLAGGPPPPGARAAAATSSRDGWLVEARRRAGRPRSSRSPTSRSRSAGWPATTSRTRSPRPAAARGARRHDRAGAPTGLVDFRPTPDRSPGRLNLFRARGAGRDRRLRPQRGRASRRVLDVAEGIAARRRAAGRAPITAIIGTAGDRPDDTLRGIGRIAAERAQRVAIKETLRSTSAAGRASRSSASCWPASAPAAGATADVPVYEIRDRGRCGPSWTDRRRAGRRGRRPAVPRGARGVFELLGRLGARPVDVATELTARAAARSGRAGASRTGLPLRRLELARIGEGRAAARRAGRGHRLAVDADRVVDAAHDEVARDRPAGGRSGRRSSRRASCPTSAHRACRRPGPRGRPRRRCPAVSPGARPRRCLSSRTMISSNARRGDRAVLALVVVAPVARDADDPDRPAATRACRRRADAAPALRRAARPSSGSRSRRAGASRRRCGSSR